jgi:multiple sugar transport system permease protein
MTGSDSGLTGGPVVPVGAPADDRRAPARGRNARQRSDARFGLALISPTVVLVVVLVVLPILWTVMLAFQDLRLIRLRTAGLLGDYTVENFVEVFTSPGFWSSLTTTLIYSVGGTAAAIGLGLVAALALRSPFRGRTLVRASLLLPYVAPVVAATFVWGVMLNPQFGVVNEVGTGLLWDEPIAFLSERPWALVTVIVFEMWRSFPFVLLFLTARLLAAPASLEEAARVDGAAPTQVFRHVVLPQLLPTIAVLALLRFIWTFNNFDDIYLLTGGGAGTEVISVRVFDYLVSRGDIGAASAQALVLATVLMVLVTVYYRFAAKDEVA